jgi:hypothetical protein
MPANRSRQLQLYWHTFKVTILLLARNASSIGVLIRQPLRRRDQDLVSSKLMAPPSPIENFPIVPVLLVLFLVAGILVWQKIVAPPTWSGYRPPSGSATAMARPNDSVGTGAQGGITDNADVTSAFGVVISRNASRKEPFKTTVYDKLYSNEQQELSREIDLAYNYVVNRFGHPASSQFDVAFARDYDCNVHGLTYADKRSLQVFTCNDIPRQRGVAILAHEFVHQLAYDRYGPTSPGADRILAEGMATWSAGTYWLGSSPDFKSFVREQRASGVFYPLTTDPLTAGKETLDPLYYEWASFVDYLLTAYDRDKFDQVYITESLHGAPGSANYQAVYGKKIDVLQKEWLAWLEQ